MSKAAELAKWGEVSTNGQVSGRRNIIINGAMQVAQRSTSVAALGATDGYFTLDRFRMTHGATSAGRYTMTQSAVTDLSGFPNALKIDCTTVDTSIAAGETLIVQHRVEGFNLQPLKATSTSTRAFTVSFYAKSNASRAINTEIRFVNGTNKQATKTHTIGTSWARYTMTVPAASSTQIDNDNSHEMDLNFWIHAGSTYQGGTVNSSLHANDATTRAAGIGSIFASTDNTLEITGVQLEVGSVATPFEHRSFGEELVLCQRYFRDLCSGINGSVLSLVTHYATTNAIGTFVLSPVMRTTPTAIAVSSASHFTTYSAAAARVCSALATDSFAPNIARMTATISSITAGYSGWIQPNTTSATMQITAEL